MMNARNGPNQQLDQMMQQHMQQLNITELQRIQAQAGAFFNNPPPQQPGKLFLQMTGQFISCIKNVRLLIFKF